MNKVKLNVVFLLLSCSQCEEYPEISKSTLEEGKPLEFDKKWPVLQITGLKNTIYHDSLSRLFSVSKLKITKNTITKIEAGALCAPTSLKALELSFAGNAQAPNLTKETFHGCTLEELVLKFDFDKPSSLEKNALEDLQLKILALHYLKFPHLDRSFLILKKQFLKTLVLSDCQVGYLDSSFFEHMVNLEDLEISHNRALKHIPEDFFRKAPKLRRLILRYNSIRELNWNEFEGLLVLQHLDLTGNRLSYFDAEKIATSLPNLKRIELVKNVWPCQLKEAFANDLRQRYKHFVDVLYSNRSCKKY